jgi:cell fate (sporulation/competence/biofilm development) regulator YmcA (YheA/YmcA/DUF963 family)
MKMAVDIATLKAEAEALLQDGEDVLKVLEDLDTVPGLQKFAKYVNDVQTVLNKIVGFIEAS